ncbi:MAG: T9SS type A sorting domain-containing protein [Candidatus Electryonea clarkiae]|nr:T9SS type A sorting domain-containing protein [Candidatus Electryonea clarkiae]MDP8288464.1 T9SS type A sorting domain-containing protein [Candidatus Electryonea clarkiae]
MNRILLIFLFAICFLSVANGDILLVPTTYETIQTAVNAVQDGDTIIVEDGEYEENVAANNVTFTIASRYILDGDTSHVDSTIIRALDDNEYYSPLRIYQELEDSIMVVGLSLTGGRLGMRGFGYFSQCGGGLYIEGGKFHIKHCTIFDNVATAGGGIYLDETVEGTIENCHIHQNRIKQIGGGICYSLDDDFDRTGYVRIENNYIHHNTAVDNTFQNTNGGGIGTMCQTTVAGYIHNNRIEHNEIYGRGGGILIGFTNLEPENRWEISANIISHNSASWGGGVRVSGVDRLNFHHNTVEENSATPGWGNGLSLENVFSSVNNIHHNLFRNNVGLLGGAIATQAKSHIYQNMFIGNQARHMSAVYFWNENNRDSVAVNVDHNVFVGHRLDDENPESYRAALSVYSTWNYLFLRQNDFLGNNSYAAGLHDNQIELQPGNMEADSNYWGDPSGPFHSEENPNGLGDMVRDNISILPFSTTPFTAPDSINILYPPDNQEYAQNIVFIWWNRTDDMTTLEPLQYVVQLAEDDEFEEYEEYSAGMDTILLIDSLDFGRTYYWRIYAEDSFELRGYSETRSFFINENSSPESSTGAVPQSWEILSPYPNPFNDSIRFYVAVPDDAVFFIEVYDILGRKAGTIFNGTLSPGYYPFTWRARSNNTSGVYFLRLNSTSGTATNKKIMFIK